MNIVVLDAQHLPSGVDFPPLQAAKYGWEQYPCLDQEGITERCWRANILISLQTPLSNELLDRLTRVVMVISPDDSKIVMDDAYLGRRNIVWQRIDNRLPGTTAQANVFCERVVQIIDQFILQNSASRTT